MDSNDNMKNNFVMQRDLVSQQSSKDGEPFVNLKKGDTISLEDDGVYLKRKITLGVEFPNWNSVFEEIKRNGELQ
jgi:hypothetical protein